jgi:hypothetical protein
VIIAGFLFLYKYVFLNLVLEIIFIIVYALLIVAFVKLLSKFGEEQNGTQDAKRLFISRAILFTSTPIII